MRHSTISLTMQVYTDPKLLDVHGALDVLPRLPLNDSEREFIQQRVKATGTDDLTPREFAPTPDKSRTPEPNHVKTTASDDATLRQQDVAVSRETVNNKHPLSTADNEGAQERATRLELATFSLGSNLGNQLFDPFSRGIFAF